MTPPTQASSTTKFKVGIFAAVGLLLTGLVSVLVNDKPYWWRPCELVKINVDDATGLKTKSPIRSLGLQVGYLATVELTETHVTLGICITAPVEVLPATRAFIRGEGFLGDKFVELKPLRYVGKQSNAGSLWDLVVPSAYAEDEGAPVVPPSQAAPAAPATNGKVERNARGEREIPVGQNSQDMQQLVGRVDDLVKEMTGVANNLKQSINPDDLRKVMRQLNTTLENASKTLSPQGGLNQTAQRALSKLEDAIEQLRDMMTRINQGKGSVGMLLNDTSYAEELKAALKNVNKLLGRASDIRFVVDIGAQKLRGYDGGRGYFKLQIWPRKDRYYLLGISLDPRGKRTVVKTTTTTGGVTSRTETESVEETGIILTGMFGKVFFDRLDMAVGALYGDGTVSAAVRLGPEGEEDRIRIQNDVYVRSGENGVTDRITLLVRPYSGLYLSGGMDSVKKTPDGVIPYFIGGGVTFDDEDIKLLFAFR